jgi:NADPH:quinone reductase-like Zn-dependent oxidoreductase
MKAITLSGFGGVENLIQTELSIPDISDNEVLVKVNAFSINPVDIKTRLGKGLALRLKEYSPIILGWDISGSVIKKGKSVDLLKEGDEVFGMVNFPGHGKAYAEYVAAHQSQLAIKPFNVGHNESAAASLAALTAWQILNVKFRIKHGYKVLIHAAAGGVGHYAVQMAKHLGAHVIGTSSGSNRDFVLGLGADEHIDYEKQNFEDEMNDVDFVLDSIGGEYIDRSLNVLRCGGTIVSIPSGASEFVQVKAKAKGIIGENFRVQSSGTDMKEIADLLQMGIVKSYVSKIFGIDEIHQAHKQIETGKTKGKIVVSLK